MDHDKAKRVKEELKAVGAGALGTHTPEGKGLVKLLHDDEHIGGVVYGRSLAGLSWLVATDQRVIFYDRKPFFNTTDEMTYDVVSGVQSNRAGVFGSVTLHTRLGDYQIRFVRKESADIFVNYIEERRLQSLPNEAAHAEPAKNVEHTEIITEVEPVPTTPPKTQSQVTPASTSGLPPVVIISQEALDFVRQNDLCVLSTVDRTGNVHGALMYYSVDSEGYIYLLTKSTTQQGRNIYLHTQVSLTIHQSGTSKSAQVQGMAEVETDQVVIDRVFSQMIKPRHYIEGAEMPPVTKLQEGNYMIIKITPISINYSDYSKSK